MKVETDHCNIVLYYSFVYNKPRDYQGGRWGVSLPFMKLLQNLLLHLYGLWLMLIFLCIDVIEVKWQYVCDVECMLIPQT